MSDDSRLMRIALSQQVARNVDENFSSALIGYGMAQRQATLQSNAAKISEMVNWHNSLISDFTEFFDSDLYQKWKLSFSMKEEADRFKNLIPDFVNLYNETLVLHKKVKTKKLQELLTDNRTIRATEKVGNLIYRLKFMLESIDSELGQVEDLISNRNFKVSSLSDEIESNFNQTEAKKLTNDLNIHYLAKIQDKLLPAYDERVRAWQVSLNFVRCNFPLSENQENKISEDNTPSFQPLNKAYVEVKEYLEDLESHIATKSSENRKARFNPKQNENSSDEGLSDQLFKLNELFKAGAISEKEFTLAKKKLLDI
ncbi:MAG: SHOCT domain-containing protein [Actinobacteria bacterium]|nr:SHOCT domain-containing protein [Actinomycetota bacterium]